MQTITVTSVAVDSPGAGQITIVGSYGEGSPVSPDRISTIAEIPAANPTFSRILRLTNEVLICYRYGSGAVAITVPSLSWIARELDGTLTWVPVIVTQPEDASHVTPGASTFVVVATSEDAGHTYLWQYADATVKALGTLTSDATAPNDGDTVTIGNKTYTFKTALTPTEGEVLIGASAATALDNLKSAVNHTGVPDTDYKCLAAHTQVTATTNTDTTQLFEALVAGTAANSYDTLEDSDHLSWGADTLLNGGWATATGVVNGCTYTNGTTTILTCTTTTTGQDGVAHRVVVTNSAGRVESSSATLTITT